MPRRSRKTARTAEAVRIYPAGPSQWRTSAPNSGHPIGRFRSFPNITWSSTCAFPRREPSRSPTQYHAPVRGKSCPRYASLSLAGRKYQSARRARQISSRRSRNGRWAVNDLFGCGRQVEPSRAVHFRTRLDPSAAWGPFDLERVAAQSRDIEFALQGKGEDGLPASLSNFTESKQVAFSLNPSSSANSLFAEASGSSPSPISPLGIDHAPRSRLDHNGPPGCTRSTSRPSATQRYIRIPALFLVIVRC